MVLPPPPLAAASPVSLLTVGVVLYCVGSIAILFACRRTRLYPLYLLKLAWVGLTIIGFTWIVCMSLADPGPKHGGRVSEFLRNPAGPFASLGRYADVAGEYYAASPQWALVLGGLLILWRGFFRRGNGGRPGEPGGQRYPRVFLAASSVIACGTLLWLDSGRAPWHLRYTAAAYVAAGGGLWVALPMRLKRGRLATALLWLLAAVAAAPAVVCVLRFDWGPYGYAANNYAFAWKTARMGRYMLNSLMVSVLAVCVTTVTASMAAYALARFEFVGRAAVSLLFVGAMAIPAQLYIVPLFLMVQNWEVSAAGMSFNFMDSRLGLSLIYAAAGLPFAVFLLTGFYRTLPGAMREAAAIDGCGEWRTFTDVYFPLAAPGLATAAIFQFLAVWNEYQFALVFLTNDSLKTLPVGLYNLSVSQQYAANWSALFAGVTILCLPTFLIFVVLQERIVAGLTAGAVKE